MSIKTTQVISRDRAVARIATVHTIVLRKKYNVLERVSVEPEENLPQFIDNGIDFDIYEIEDWTNEMLADQMDKPFFRYSMFENYLVKG